MDYIVNGESGCLLLLSAKPKGVKEDKFFWMEDYASHVVTKITIWYKSKN